MSYRQKDNCVLRKVHTIRLHFRENPLKNIIPYYYPGLVQPWMRSWIATLSQSILIRYVVFLYGGRDRRFFTFQELKGSDSLLRTSLCRFFLAIIFFFML